MARIEPAIARDGAFLKKTLAIRRSALSSQNSLMRTCYKEEELTQRVDQLPVLPAVVSRILALNPADPRYVEQIVRLAEGDPSFAVRILRAANSSTNSSISPVVTVRQAVTRLGAQACADLVIEMSVSKVFVPRNIAQKDLWTHALQVAVSARVIASLAINSGVAPEEAYLGGLVHDIGRFVMFEAATADFNLVEENDWKTPQALLDTERSALGYDHTEIGATICRKWSLPPILIETVKRHHSYQLDDRGATTTVEQEFIRIVQMADLLSVWMMRNPERTELDPYELSAELSARCVRREWRRTPVSPSVLAPRVASIRDESDAHIKRLFPV